MATSLFMSMYRKELTFLNTVNKAIVLKPDLFKIYRTINGSVQACELLTMGIDLETGELLVTYEGEKGLLQSEKATKLDLQLISQRATQEAEKCRSNQMNGKLFQIIETDREEEKES